MLFGFLAVFWRCSKFPRHFYGFSAKKLAHVFKKIIGLRDVTKTICCVLKKIIGLRGAMKTRRRVSKKIRGFSDEDQTSR